MISLIAAFAHRRVIGKDNAIPWKLPADMQHFRKVTTGSTVIMGRHTYDSFLQGLGGPLPKRRNIVVSTSLKSVKAGFELAASLEEALTMSQARQEDNEVFIIGGAKLYSAALDQDLVDSMYLTEIAADIDGDAFFPTFDPSRWFEISRLTYPRDEKNEFDMSFIVLVRSRDEAASLNL